MFCFHSSKYSSTCGYDPWWVIPWVHFSRHVADTHTHAPGAGKSWVWVRVRCSLPTADTRTRGPGVGKSQVWVRVRPPIPGGIPMQLPTGCTSTDYHTFRWPNIIATGRPTLYVCLLMYCPCRFSQPPTGPLVGRCHPYVCYHIYQSVHNALQCTQFCGPAGPSCMCCWPKFRWYHFYKGLYIISKPLSYWAGLYITSQHVTVVTVLQIGPPLCSRVTALYRIPALYSTATKR